MIGGFVDDNHERDTDGDTDQRKIKYETRNRRLSRNGEKRSITTIWNGNRRSTRSGERDREDREYKSSMCDACPVSDVV